MPIHLHDLDVISKLAGCSSALILPCIMCPAATVAVRKQQPFMRLFRSWLTSAPLEDYLRELKARLKDAGVRTDVFKSRLYHQWFLCMWTARRRRKLLKYATRYEAVIVLGCGSATATVKDALKSTDCKVIEGMEVAGIMNAKLRLRLPCNLSFDDCKITPIRT
jgi:hypothetical protein